MTGRVQTEAERQTARYSLLSPSQAAERLGDVDAETVRSWIEAGWLPRCDTRRPGSKRPRYRLRWEWLEDFINNGGAPKPKEEEET